MTDQSDRPSTCDEPLFECDLTTRGPRSRRGSGGGSWPADGLFGVFVLAAWAVYKAVAYLRSRSHTPTKVRASFFSDRVEVRRVPQGSPGEPGDLLLSSAIDQSRVRIGSNTVSINSRAWDINKVQRAALQRSINASPWRKHTAITVM